MKTLFKKLEQLWTLDYSENVFIGLSNILPNLIPELVTALGEEYSYILTTADNTDIQKYLKTVSLLNKNDKFPTLQGLLLTLDEFGFERVSKTSAIGEWSTKGDTLTLWPVGYSNPIRISFFGDEVEKISIYDAVYGAKLANLEQLVVGNLHRVPEFVDRHKIRVMNETKPYHKLFIVLKNFRLDASNQLLPYLTEKSFDFKYPELFFSNIDLLTQSINSYESNLYRIQIQTNHKERIPEALQKYIIKSDRRWDAGFVSDINKLVLLTDRELFGTIFLHNGAKNISSRQANKILERLEGEILEDDFVVHEDHGIGVYKGIVQETSSTRVMEGFDWVTIKKTVDYLKIEYAEDDELLIPIAQLHKITKYIGTTNEEPNITRLHKGSWQTLIRRTKKAVEVIARDLVEHYAKLELATADSIEYEHSGEFLKFIDAFEYEETPDQLRVSDEIYRNLSSSTPMDRLIVGDVGFGKTEVSMRAAYKVVESGHQVAVLCPTTVLAAQHLKVFKDRFAGTDAKVAYVSRFNSSKENRDIIEEANLGSIDILIGTHRLLSNDVEFDNLGLIIIDEEQKFGVKQKEKIRKIQYSAHTLSMTATPIPRTLSMAMSEIKDISIMTTPPADRKAVETVVEKLDWNKVVLHLQYEHKRSGQSYFLHNKVESIESVTAKLQTLLPGLNIGFAHGQMNPKKLNSTINEFYNKQYDVLVCTTIIENGIDMPNVNTIIINDGQNFGLGQLYQLRGRVGRSDKKAYCYIYYKGHDLNEKQEAFVSGPKKKKKKPRKYEKRLKAILEAQELGSGFKLASRDLEIRGAGSLLGEQQHGNIKNVGLGLYMQMLAEEIDIIKQENEYTSKSNT